jgi:hypothetical protein
VTLGQLRGGVRAIDGSAGEIGTGWRGSAGAARNICNLSAAGACKGPLQKLKKKGVSESFVHSTDPALKEAGQKLHGWV